MALAVRPGAAAAASPTPTPAQLDQLAHVVFTQKRHLCNMVRKGGSLAELLSHIDRTWHHESHMLREAQQLSRLDESRDSPGTGGGSGVQKLPAAVATASKNAALSTRMSETTLRVGSLALRVTDAIRRMFVIFEQRELRKYFSSNSKKTSSSGGAMQAPAPPSRPMLFDSFFQCEMFFSRSTHIGTEGYLHWCQLKRAIPVTEEYFDVKDAVLSAAHDDVFDVIRLLHAVHSSTGIEDGSLVRLVRAVVHCLIVKAQGYRVVEHVTRSGCGICGQFSSETDHRLTGGHDAHEFCVPCRLQVCLNVADKVCLDEHS